MAQYNHKTSYQVIIVDIIGWDLSKIIAHQIIPKWWLYWIDGDNGTKYPLENSGYEVFTVSDTAIKPGRWIPSQPHTPLLKVMWMVCQEEASLRK